MGLPDQTLAIFYDQRCLSTYPKMAPTSEPSFSTPLPEASSFNQMTISHRSIHCCILIETSFPSGETPFHQSSFESTISSETYLSSRSSACSNSGGGGS